MNKIADEINQDRRRFFGTAAMAFAATQLGMIGTAAAQREAQIPAVKPGTNTSIGSLRQIDAGVLNVGYAEAGPANGPPVILLHVGYRHLRTETVRWMKCARSNRKEEQMMTTGEVVEFAALAANLKCPPCRIESALLLLAD